MLQGDSGSSAIYQTGGSYESVGVVSWGIEGCQSGAPSVMARVTYFLDWINQEISHSALCPRDPIPSPSTSEPDSCQTVSGAQPGVPCLFPFTVANITIAGCTRIDGDLTAWCATAVNDQVKVQNSAVLDIPNMATSGCHDVMGILCGVGLSNTFDLENTDLNC